MSGRTRFAHLCAVLSCILQPEETSDVISGRFVRPIVLEKRVKMGHPRLNRSREIPPEAVVPGGIFYSFCRLMKRYLSSCPGRTDGRTRGNAFGASEIDHMCGWGANRNPWVGYRMAPSPIPHVPPNPQTGVEKVLKMGRGVSKTKGHPLSKRF